MDSDINVVWEATVVTSAKCQSAIGRFDGTVFRMFTLLGNWSNLLCMCDSEGDGWHVHTRVQENVKADKGVQKQISRRPGSGPCPWALALRLVHILPSMSHGGLRHISSVSGCGVNHDAYLYVGTRKKGHTMLFAEVQRGF
jgi:hypothetical protein